MKKLCFLPAILALAAMCSCQKQETEAERNAEIERQVQQRLAAERQAQEQKQLSERVTQLEAQQRNAAEQSAQPAPTQTVESEQPSLSSGGVTRRDREGREATATYSTFYTRLEPHGVWRETSTYGYVWQPREAWESRGWRPYTNGHWVYTDAGWTWVSNEPFGWATYHYGRWTRLRGIGWVWVPGEDWAPAWVSWRKSNDYVGWAPLPPEAHFERNTGIHNWADNYYDIGPDQYCFVSTNDLGSERVEQVVVPPERNIMIVNQTINVTNITYNNTTVVNQGPSYEEIRSRTRQPIPRLRLERQTNVNANSDNRPVVSGETLQVPAPVIAAQRSNERPATVKETVRETTVEHGWENVTNQQEAEKLRSKIRAEATPPPNAPSRTFVRRTEPNSSITPSPSPSIRASASPSAAPSVSASPIETSTPRPTPVRRQSVPASTATETPATSRSIAPVTPTPFPTMTPHPIRNPRPLDTNPSLTTPTLSPAPNQPSNESREQRLREIESRRQQHAAERPPPPVGFSSSSVTPLPSRTPESALESLKKQERNKRKRERDSEMNETPSPTPSA